MILSTPPVPPEFQKNSVAIVRSISSYSDFWTTYPEVIPQAPKSSASFWTKELHFKQLEVTALKTKDFRKGWDGYDAPAPNSNAIVGAIRILERVRGTNLNPSSILPSADGGVGICFRGTGQRRALIEILNDGTTTFLQYGRGFPTRGDDFDVATDLDSVFRQLGEYL